MSERSDSRLWARATMAAAVATCGLVVVHFLVERGRIEFLSRDSLSLPIFLGLGVTAMMLAAAWFQPPEGEGRRYARWLALLYAAGAVAFVVGTEASYPIFTRVYEQSPRSINRNNLKQIILALHLYAGYNGDKLPGPAVCDPDGKPLLSWRVAILPYLEEDNLYRQFHLDEPWDSPHNVKLLPRMPKVYSYCDPGTPTPDGHTHWQAFVGPGTPFERKGLKLPTDIPDGTSKTIGIIEAAVAVPWTKPDDLAYGTNLSSSAIGTKQPVDPRRKYALAGLMDGLTWTVDLTTITDATLRAAITRNGNETLGPDW